MAAARGMAVRGLDDEPRLLGPSYSYAILVSPLYTDGSMGIGHGDMGARAHDLAHATARDRGARGASHTIPRSGIAFSGTSGQRVTQSSPSPPQSSGPAATDGHSVCHRPDSESSSPSS